MSNFNPKAELQESQGQASAFPKLNIAYKIDLKESNGQAVFSTFNKDTKENNIVDSPIQGIFIGAGMQMSSYSDNLGVRGGNYMSDYYFSNKNIVLFAPASKGYEVVCKGSSDYVEAYINRKSTSNPKKKQVLFILNESGLIAVITNLSIAIDQLTKNKEALGEKYIILSPQIFKESSQTISKKAKEYLGKFRTKNPPKYAEISVGEFITEKDWNDWNASEVIKQFKAFKEYKSGTVEPLDIEPAKEETPAPKVDGKPEAKASPVQTYTDDLPF